ncbi:helix-turn-helix transcriptional regulator [Nocardioides piscis]|uniref:Response regulator transcription factor n=1 Tax=Nocardioides piscis TaxID=2714938 RepID=A0A6G7YG10_9ACTN|nr:response regulator transcription factor [Nocardioides piscis]QIK75581.1 response regulator transcription factor [Nocardioides piscis]
MTAIPHRRRALRVTTAHESELATAGLAVMLAPYAHRIELLASPGGQPASGADVTLHDTFAGAEAPPVANAPVVVHDGQLVTWTWNARPDLVEMALGNGASGVLSKQLPAARLVAALESIHHGRPVVDLGDERRPASAPRMVEALTPREAQVIAMITQGYDNQSIAEQGCISINSVKSYIRSAYRKMGVTSRTQAVLWGVRRGYLAQPARAEAAGLTA